MKNKINIGAVLTLIVSIGAFGVFESLQAAPKESQRLRGMEGRVTPAQGSGVLQLEAITDIFNDIYDEDGNVIQRIPFGSLLAVGHEVDENDCPPPFPPEG